MPFQYKNVVIVGQSHIEIYGWDESNRDVIHKQNHHIIVEWFKIPFYDFILQYRLKYFLISPSVPLFKNSLFCSCYSNFNSLDSAIVSTSRTIFGFAWDLWPFACMGILKQNHIFLTACRNFTSSTTLWSVL